MLVLTRLLYERFKYVRLKFGLDSLDVFERGALLEVMSRGFSVRHNYLPADECARIRGDLDDVFRKRPQDIQWDETRTDARIVGAEREIAGAKAFHIDTKTSSMAKAFYSEPTTNLFVLGAKMSFHGDNLGSGNGWHRDSFSPQFKAMLYLSDVDELNGPFQYVPNSHGLAHMLRFNRFLKQPKLSKRYTPEGVASFCSRAGEKQWASLTGKAGTLIIFDSSGLHRGAPIEQGSRYALTSYFMRSRSIDVAKHRKFGLPEK